METHTCAAMLGLSYVFVFYIIVAIIFIAVIKSDKERQELLQDCEWTPPPPNSWVCLQPFVILSNQSDPDAVLVLSIRPPQSDGSRIMRTRDHKWKERSHRVDKNGKVENNLI